MTVKIDTLGQLERCLRARDLRLTIKPVGGIWKISGSVKGLNDRTLSDDFYTLANALTDAVNRFDKGEELDE